MEWPFSFQTGSRKTALIQISPDLRTCFLLHVSELENLPYSFKKLLTHPNVGLTGVNIVKYVKIFLFFGIIIITSNIGIVATCFITLTPK